jgi:hypothetical protein
MRLHTGPDAKRWAHLVALTFVFILSGASTAFGFWVVNLGPAQPLDQGQFSMVAGIGGQYVSVGSPRTDNMFFFIPHAGIRYGAGERFDLGIRMAPVPVPFTTEAPPVGANIDAKFLFNDRHATWKVAGLVGAGIAHAQILNEHRFAYSPNAALLVTRSLPNGMDFTTMLRYSWMGIPTAPGGTGKNQVHIAGMSWGLKVPLLERISFLPEFGAFRYDGRLSGNQASGFAIQYALALSVTF